MNIKRNRLRSRSVAFLLVLSILLAASGCALTEGDPPPVPHAATGAFADCRTCHATGAGGAPLTDHPQRAECLKCHAPRETGGP